MNRKKIFPTFLFFLFLIIPLSFAYPHLGGTDYNFLMGDSNFDANANATIIPNSPSNALIRPVLIKDIDNDGIEEVIGMTAVGFEIYSLPSLGLEKLFIHNTSFTTAARDFDIIDIDDDGFFEIIASYTLQGDDTVTISYIHP